MYQIKRKGKIDLEQIDEELKQQVQRISAEVEFHYDVKRPFDTVGMTDDQIESFNALERGDHLDINVLPVAV